MARVPKTSRVEHQTPKKARFRALVEDAGWGQERAARKLKIPQSTATKWLKQVDERRTGKHREGRPRLIDEKMLDKIEKWFDGHYDRRIQTLEDIIKHFKLECSTTTLLRALDRRGFHKHTPEIKEWIPPKIKEERFGFAKKHKTKKKTF